MSAIKAVRWTMTPLFTVARSCGSFSAVSASLQQLSGGLGSVLAAAIIAQNADGALRHFDRWLVRRIGTKQWCPGKDCRATPTT
jgi:hypothetical protein